MKIFKLSSLFLVFLVCLPFFIHFDQIYGCTVIAGTYGKAFMHVYHQNGSLLETSDLGEAGWGPDCQLSQNLYQFDNTSFFLRKQGKLFQYSFDTEENYPKLLEKQINFPELNASYYFGHFDETNYFPLVNESDANSWIVSKKIFFSTPTNNYWKIYQVNISELLSLQTNLTDINNLSIQIENYSFQGQWLLFWGLLSSNPFILTINLKTNTTKITVFTNNTIFFPTRFDKVMFSENGKYLVTFPQTFITGNQIRIMNLITKVNYTLTIPTTNDYEIKALITNKPEPLLLQNTIYVETYPFRGIFKINLETNATSLYFNASSASLTYFSILDPYLITTTLRLYNNFPFLIGIVFILSLGGGIIILYVVKRKGKNKY